ncbi:protein NEDD1 [Spea bombifrons]|uniref:protein NEDD1 n=1 Tax=Spea bombifrons TaxID=233779 RepID=UPI00234A6523|nr:protein NEDD1 [Spea bombifrons]
MQDSMRFASAGDDIKIWDSSSMTVVEQFNPHSPSHAVSSLCWSSNNHFLVTASSSGDKIVVSSCKSKPVSLLELGDGKRQTCVNLNSSSQYVVSGGLDNTVNIWDLKSKRLHRSLKDHKDEVTCVTFNGNDCYVASGSLSGEIILHNVTTNLSSTPFGHGSSQPIRHLKYSFVKKFMLGTVSDSGSVTLWDANSQTPYHMFESTHKAPASGICFSPVNDLLLVTIGLDKRIICYDVSRKLHLQTVVAESPLTAFDFMPDGLTLAVGSSRGKIYLYDLRMLTSPVKTVSAHKTSVQCIQFQHSIFKSSKGSSSKLSSKKTSIKSSAVVGGAHGANLGRDLPPAVSASTLPQPSMTVQSKGIELNEEKTGMPHSTSLDIIPSKETDYTKASLDSFGRSSLGDVFSPVRDDALHLKATDDFVSKGNDLDYLGQYNTIPSTRRNPVGANSQGIHSSPLHLIIGSPIKEEDESPDPETRTRKPHFSKQEMRESTKLLSKTQNPELINLNTSPVPVISRTPEAIERTGKQIMSQMKQDFPSNGNLVASPTKVPTSSSTDVASSLSEKIADTLASDRSAAPLTSVQINFIKNMIEETLDDFREACHRDIVNLQVEMIKQFHIQSSEIHTLLERYSINEGLVAEIEKLREENKKLRAHF